MSDPQPQHPQPQVVIIGGGLVGVSLALGLAHHGVASHVIDSSDPDALTAPGFDGRASAISTASWNYFTNLGLADRLAAKGCPISAISVSDQLKPGQLDFRPSADQGALGYMYANRDLRIALYQAAAEQPLIHLHFGARVVERARDAHGVAAILADGNRLTGKLLVGAEGRKSPTREDAGITVAKWDYSHRAMIAGLVHEKIHEGVAWEVFYPAGPFALLPLTDDEQGRHRSALVWTVSERDAAGVLKLSDNQFRAEVEKRAGGILGAIHEVGPRASYPLGFHHTARITADRLALVGDAGHGLHPIAGQGFNLGLRDAAALVEVIVEGRRLGLDPGDAQLLARYERWRGLDSMMTAVATDWLTRLFGVPGKLPSAVRRLGLRAVQRTPVLKTWFMEEARGTSGAMPELMRA